MTSFQHSGDLGDVIYSLPVIRYMGGGSLYLSPAPFTRLKFDEQRAAVIKPLLESQPYIHRAALHCGRQVGINLDHFRRRMRDKLWCETLAQMHCRHFNVPESELERRWISVTPKKIAPVVINLTERYRNPDFPWHRVYGKFKDDAVFVGLTGEHEMFEAHYGKITYYRTKNLLELAQVIAGSDLFCGNQSCPLAIAHAMLHPSIMEASRNACNGHLRNGNCRWTAGSTIEIPSLRRVRFERVRDSVRNFIMEAINVCH